MCNMLQCKALCAKAKNFVQILRRIRHGKNQKNVSMILSVLMAASVLTTAPVSAATVEASDAGANVAEAQQAELKIAEGSCGDKLTWVLDNDGVLEISGEGKMYDFDFEAKEDENSFNPWTLYRDQIKKVVVKDGVEYIGNFAFFGFAELEEAQISDSVKEIGENAFEGCDKLDKTTLPEVFTEPAKVEETTKISPVIIKEEEEAVGAAAEEAVGASVSISKCTIALSTTSCTYLDLGKYTNSSNINEVVADENSTSVINCFQASFINADISYLIRETTKCGYDLSYVESTNPVQSEYIKAFENEFAKDKKPMLVVYRIEGKNNYIANNPYVTTSHAVVAYGVEDYYYTYTFDNNVTKTYDKRVLIYDPNNGSANALSKNNCIYYNSSDYSWICPACTGYSDNCYWNSNMGTSIKTGSISSITKIHSISVAENVLNHVSYDYLTRKYPSSVGADEGISDHIDFKWATLDDLVENENALSVSTKGDVNGDGSIDVSDANAIQMYLAGITELSDAQLSVADANNDGVVSVDDSLYIQLMLAELV